MTSRINVEMLRDVYDNDDAAGVIFDDLAERNRNHRETSPESVMAILYQNDLSVDRADVIAFFRKLEAAGCGKYIEGRRGHRSRFQWYAKMIDVAVAAQGGEPTVSEIGPDDDTFIDDEDEDSLEEGEEEEEPEGTITHQFVLRPDFSIRINLPSDLKTGEAARISDWIKTLPFE